MAVRWCGGVKVTMVFLDEPGDWYRCVVSVPGKVKPAVYRIGAAAGGFGDGVAYDSPAAYQATARAALSFATSDNDELNDYVQSWRPCMPATDDRSDDTFAIYTRRMVQPYDEVTQ